MHQRLAAILGAAATIGLFALTNAKRLADAISIIHLPHDVGEFLTAMSGVSELVSYGALAIGIACLAYLAWSSRKPKRSKVAEPPPANQSDKEIASIQFKWTPGGAGAPYEIRAIVTPYQNLKNFVLLGALATATHYLGGTCKWVWEPSLRLLKLTDLFKGEVRSSQILFCWRTVTPVANPITIFEKKAPDLKDDQLLMLRVSAICDSGAVYLQEAYHVRRIGESIIVDPMHQDHIAYVEDANSGL
jgi:hypothetical protein